jgi:sporulation protein YlmC with PRC-barrel domain
MEEEMLAKHLALALVGTALASAPALAQTQAPGTTTGAPATMAQPSTAPASGMASGNFMTQMQPNHWEASDLEGLNVYNNNNENIGDISELIVDSSGKIQAVVIGVGGFLGLGERSVAVPFEQVKFVNEPRAGATATNPPAAGTTTTTGATTGTSPATTGSTGTMGTAGTAAPADTAARRGPDHAMLNMTKDQLTAAPEFKKR